jgi:hypothetical protein
MGIREAGRGDEAEEEGGARRGEGSARGARGERASECSSRRRCAGGGGGGVESNGQRISEYRAPRQERRGSGKTRGRGWGAATKQERKEPPCHKTMDDISTPRRNPYTRALLVTHTLHTRHTRAHHSAQRPSPVAPIPATAPPCLHALGRLPSHPRTVLTSSPCTPSPPPRRTTS